jgi:hypothetical protein
MVDHLLQCRLWKYLYCRLFRLCRRLMVRQLTELQCLWKVFRKVES